MHSTDGLLCKDGCIHRAGNTLSNISTMPVNVAAPELEYLCSRWMLCIVYAGYCNNKITPYKLQ